MRRCSFAVCRLPMGASEVGASSYDLETFDMGQPQPAMPQASHVGAGFASISSAFQRLRRQRQPEQQRPPPAALFSVAKAEAKQGPQPERGFKVTKIAPDGRCLFRALAAGMSYNQGYFIVGSEEEQQDADALRMATFDALCRNGKRQKQFKEAIFAVSQEATLPTYCSRLQKDSFWGGNVEMLVLSKMLEVPITVYQDVSEQEEDARGYLPIAKYGAEFAAQRQPVAVLYTQGNHYDLLTK